MGTTTAAVTIAAAAREGERSISDFAEDMPPHDPQAVRRQLTGQAQLQVCYQCHFCGTPSSSLDLACSHCSATVCTSCIPRRMANDTHCPRCRNPEFCTASTLRVLAGATQV